MTAALDPVAHWTAVLDALEASADAQVGPDAGAESLGRTPTSPWAPPAVPLALPPELRERARRVLERLEVAAATTAERMGQVRSELQALHRRPGGSASPSPSYVDRLA